jgi:nitrogen-specific signal transduction histidine kinase
LTLGREDVVFSDDSRRRLLDVIFEQSERLADMVNDILLASQVDDGKLRLATEQVDAALVARRVVEAARTHAPTQVTLDLVAPPALPPSPADADKLQQALGNLVGNAVRVLARRRPDRDSAQGARAGSLHHCSRRRHRNRRLRAAVDLREVLPCRSKHDPRCNGSGLGLYIARAGPADEGNIFGHLVPGKQLRRSPSSCR